MEFGGAPANVYYFLGQNHRLPDPEKTVMFVIASPEALITVEVCVDCPDTIKQERIKILKH